MILRTGSLNRDTFLGSGEADHFIAGAEDDIPYGNGGADPFQAGDGDGRLHGGSDRDTMLGGAANDGRDIFPCTAGDGVDLIWGFRPGQDFRVTGCTPADVDAFTCIRPVENTGRDGVNPLDAGTSLLVAQMPVRAAQPVAPAPTAPTPAPLPPAEEVSATV